MSFSTGLPNSLRALLLITCLAMTNIAFAHSELEQHAESITQVRHQIDANADGIPERIEIILVDPHGRSVGYQSDVNADGVSDYRVDIQRDVQGRPLAILTDINGDGIADSIEDRVYGASGVRVRVDLDADGLFDEERVLSKF